jgi:predicted glycosyltransferase
LVDLKKRKILFISGSIGLGHIGRDIEIAKALRNADQSIDISWLAEDPASTVLTQAGETLLPEAKQIASWNTKLENSASEYNTNLVRITMNVRKDWSSNAKIVARAIQECHFDLVIGDETYELLVEMVNHSDYKKFPFVMIYDFIGIDTVTSNPLDKFYGYMINRVWAEAMEGGTRFAEKSLFIGEPQDIPDRNFGFMLPNRRELAMKNLDFVGYILSFNPDSFKEKEKVRKNLGYGNEPLIVCSIGGTSAGKDLLDLCAKAYPLIKKEIPDLKMILVCGPHLPTNFIQAQEGIEIRGYVPELYRHLAAADLAIVTGGGTITLELTALQKPFLYFPLRAHFEQEVAVANRCSRHGAGVRMDYDLTTPEQLAKTVLSNIHKKVNYSSIPINGAKEAAKLIEQTLREKTFG